MGVAEAPISTRRARVREDRIKNAKALALIGLPMLILALLAFRPAIVLGVKGDALANSINGVFGGRCHEVDSSLWRCDLYDRDGSNAVSADVRTSRFGCWEIAPRGKTADDPESGCINVFDLYGGWLVND